MTPVRPRKLIVAIDGPAGAGKSTIAKIVARELGYLYIDTGAMYRAVALKTIQEKTNMRDELAVTRLAARTRIVLKTDPKTHQLRVFLDGKDVSAKIRTERVSRQTSAVAKVQGVRDILRKMQRKMGKNGGVVMEGRDIGTAVFPKAQVKFYLDASPAERAQRRYRELKARGKRVSLARIAHAIAQRDYKDKNRGIAPLLQAADAIVVDSTHLSLEQAAKKILDLTILHEHMESKLPKK